MVVADESDAISSSVHHAAVVVFSGLESPSMSCMHDSSESVRPTVIVP